MASKPQGDSQKGSSGDSSRQPMPFEPVKSRKQVEQEKQLKEKKAAKRSPAPSASAKTSAKSVASPQRQTSTGIPEVVSRRMVKRMAVFCGIPTVLGMSTFIASYLIVSKDLFPLPTYAVLLVSLGWFGLGVLGLSYGALSASWDEETAGSRLGWPEFTTNWKRMAGAWQEAKEQNKER